jgi:hypothetical protein
MLGDFIKTLVKNATESLRNMTDETGGWVNVSDSVIDLTFPGQKLVQGSLFAQKGWTGQYAVIVVAAAMEATEGAACVFQLSQITKKVNLGGALVSPTWYCLSCLPLGKKTWVWLARNNETLYIRSNVYL